jgi:hypothetical protein
MRQVQPKVLNEDGAAKRNEVDCCATLIQRLLALAGSTPFHEGTRGFLSVGTTCSSDYENSFQMTSQKALNVNDDRGCKVTRE